MFAQQASGNGKRQQPKWGQKESETQQLPQPKPNQPRDPLRISPKKPSQTRDRTQVGLAGNDEQPGMLGVDQGQVQCAAGYQEEQAPCREQEGRDVVVADRQFAVPSRKMTYGPA
jgi:hypothetical protein